MINASCRTGSHVHTCYRLFFYGPNFKFRVLYMAAMDIVSALRWFVHPVFVSCRVFLLESSLRGTPSTRKSPAERERCESPK